MHRLIAQLSVSPSLDFPPCYYGVLTDNDERKTSAVRYQQGEMDDYCCLRHIGPDVWFFLGDVELFQYGKMGLFRTLCSKVSSI